MSFYDLLRDDDGNPLYIRGYAAVFNSFSHPMEDRGGRREMIQPRAFNPHALSNALPLYSHMQHAPLGARSSLKTWIDGRGLACEIGPLASNGVCLSVAQQVFRGTAARMSFLGCIYGRVDPDIDAFVVDTVEGLLDVGPCGDGARYPETGCWLSNQPLGRGWLAEMAEDWSRSRASYDLTPQGRVRSGRDRPSDARSQTVRPAPRHPRPSQPQAAGGGERTGLRYTFENAPRATDLAPKLEALALTMRGRPHGERRL